MKLFRNNECLPDEARAWEHSTPFFLQTPHGAEAATMVEVAAGPQVTLGKPFLHVFERSNANNFILAERVLISCMCNLST